GLGVGREDQGAGCIGAGDVGVQRVAVGDVVVVPAVEVRWGGRPVVGDDRRGLVDLEAGAGDARGGVAGQVGAAVGRDGQGDALTGGRLGLGVGREDQGAGCIGAGDVGVQRVAVGDVVVVPAVEVGRGRRPVVGDDRRGLV